MSFTLYPKSSKVRAVEPASPPMLVPFKITNKISDVLAYVPVYFSLP